MKRNKIFPIALMFIVLLLASIACEASASTANITNAHMAIDENDSAETTVYASSDPAFHCFFDLNNAPDETVVRGVWTLVEADGYESNQVIDEVEYTGSDDTVNLYLERGADEWPVGSYKIELYLNDELVETLEFEVQ
jgi:hypothetical protein